MALETSDLIRAAAHVQSNGVTPVYGYVATLRPNSGFNQAVAIIRNGAGDYTLTLMEAIDLNSMSVMIQAPVNAAAGAQITAGWVLVTPTTIRVTVFVTAGLADTDFDIWIMKFPQV